METESKNEWIYVYVLLMHFPVQQKLTQHCGSAILQQKLIQFFKKSSHHCYF